MKNIKYLLMFALAYVFAACSEEDCTDVRPSMSDDIIELRVNVNRDSTRVSYDDGGNVMFKWTEGDKLTVLSYNADGKYIGSSDFDMKVYDPEYPVFAGRLVEGAKKVRVVYKAKNMIISDSGQTSVDYSTQTQDLNNAAAHVNDYLLLESRDLQTTNFKLFDSVILTPRNSMLRLDVKSFPQDLGTITKIELNTNIFNAEPRTTALNVSNGTREGFKAFMMFDPQQMAAKSNSYFTIKFYGSSGLSKSVYSKIYWEKFNTSGRRYRLTVYQNEILGNGQNGLNNWYEGKVSAEYGTIVSFEAGNITKDIINKAQVNNSLRVVGLINGTDIRALRESTGCPYHTSGTTDTSAPVNNLNLNSAVIVAGGEAYADNDSEGKGTKGKVTTKDNTIGAYMFMKSNLQDLSFPLCDIEIESHALDDIEHMSSMYINENVKKIGSSIASGTLIQTLYLNAKKTNTIMAEDAFKGIKTRNGRLESVINIYDAAWKSHLTSDAQNTYFAGGVWGNVFFDGNNNIGLDDNIKPYEPII